MEKPGIVHGVPSSLCWVGQEQMLPGGALQHPLLLHCSSESPEAASHIKPEQTMVLPVEKKNKIKNQMPKCQAANPDCGGVLPVRREKQKNNKIFI